RPSGSSLQRECAAARQHRATGKGPAAVPGRVRRNPQFALGLVKLGSALRRSGQHADGGEAAQELQVKAIHEIHDLGGPAGSPVARASWLVTYPYTRTAAEIGTGRLTRQPEAGRQEPSKSNRPATRGDRCRQQPYSPPILKSLSLIERGAQAARL